MPLILSNKLILFAFILCSLFSIAQTITQSLNVASNNSYAGQSATYNITVYRNNSNSITSAIISFSSIFNLSLVNNACTPNCVINSLNVSFTNLTSPTNMVQNFIIPNVLNPILSQQSTSGIYITFFYASSNESITSMNSLIINPGKATCTLSFMNFTNTNGMAQFNFINTQIIPNGSSILYITFPSTWSNNAKNSSLNKGFVSKNNTLNGVSGNVISPNLQFLTPSPNLTNTNMIFTLVANGNIAISTNISFQLNNVNMPPTQNSYDIIQVGIGNSTTNFYDRNNCNLPMVTPVSTITGSILNLSNLTINSLNANGMIIQLGNFLDNQYDPASNDTVKIIYPTSIFDSIQNINKSINIISSPSVYVNQLNVNSLNGNTMIYTTSNSSRSDINQAFQLMYYELGFNMPNTTSTIYFQIYFIRNQSTYIYSKVPLTATSGNIANITFGANPSTIGSVSSYSFTFYPQDSFSINGGVLIVFPSFINISNVYISTPSNTTSILSSSTINISNIVNGSFTGNSSIKLIINNISNPNTTGIIGDIAISTYDNMTDSASLVDSGSFTPTFTPYLISNGTLNISNQTVIAPALYTFNYQNFVSLPNTVVFLIVFPSNFTCNNTSNTILINSITPGTQGITVNKNNITISLNFINNTVPSGSNISMNINIINPQMGGQYPIIIYQSSNDGYQLEIISFLGIINIAAQFTSFTFSPTVKLTGSNSLYQFDFRPSVYHPIGSFLNITLPTGISYSSLTCICSFNCSALNYSSYILIYINSEILVNNSNINIFKLNNMINPRSTKPFSFVITSSYNGNLLNTYSIPQSQMQNNVMAIQFFSNSGQQNYYNSSEGIGISIMNVANQLSVNDCLWINFDYTYYTSLSNASCNSSNQYICKNNNNNTNITIVCLNNPSTNSWPITSINLIILGYQIGFGLPSADSQGIVVTSMDSLNYTMDISNNLLFVPTCSSMCKKCDSVNLSKCNSCYDNILITGQLYYNNITNICTNNCSSINEFYYQNGSICVVCPSPCYTCSNYTTCFSCINNYYYQNYTCISSCTTTGYFIGSAKILSINYTFQTCQKCNTTCINCTSLNNCQICMNGYLLQNGICVTSCSSTYYLNLSNCLPCYSTCGSCSGGTSFNCITCVDNINYYFIRASNSCVTICPNTTVTYNITRQCICDSNCSECSYSLKNCTGCIANYYVYNGNCISQCPNITYINAGYCIPCSIGCFNCTIAGCMNCNNNYYLYNGFCYTSCSSIGQGYVADVINYICIKCSTGCSYCFYSNPSNCSSCINGYILSSNQCISGKNTVSQIDNSIQGKIFMATLLSLCIFTVVHGIISKVHFKHIFLPYSITTLNSMLQITAIIYLYCLPNTTNSRLLIAQNYLNTGKYLLLFSVGLNYLLNLAHIYVYIKYLKNDDLFMKNKKNTQNQILDIVVLIFSTLTNFRLYQIVFSKLCNIKLFNTKLTNIKKFTYINILNVINLIGSILGFIGACIICSSATVYQSQLLAGITCIIIILINIIFTLLSFVKNDEFFNNDEKYEESQNPSQHNYTQQQIMNSGGKDKPLFEQTADKRSIKLQSIEKIADFQIQNDGDQPIAKKSKIQNLNPLNSFNNHNKIIPIDSLAKQNSINNLSEVQFKSSVNNTSKKQSNIQYNSMDIPLNEKSNKGRYRKRAAKIPLKQKKKTDQMLEIRQINNQIQQQKVDTIINQINSQMESNKNFVETIQKNKSVIFQKQIKQQNKESIKKNILTSHIEQNGSHKQSRINQQDNIVVIKIKQKDKNKATSENLLKQITLDENANQSLKNNNNQQEYIDMEFIDKFYQNNHNSDYTQPQVEYNEISPSQFNLENQRFEIHDFADTSQIISVQSFQKNKKFDYENDLKEFKLGNLTKK